VINVTDQRLSTFYKPKGERQAGSLNYKISKNTQLSQVIILQDPSALSDAEVSVRDVNGWHKIGKLSQSFNSLNTSRYKHVLEVMIQWTGDVSPIINEIITVKRDGNLPRVQVDLLDEELQLAFDQGLITHKGILNSLLAKADAIQKHHGNKEQSLKILNAFENEVKAQSDKKVNKDYSKLLLEITDEIRIYFTAKE
jgi:hyaluronoglucosaminidase